MSILFVPDYRGGNPYQTNLASSLDERVTYGHAASRVPITRALLTGDVSVVHVHWLNTYFNGETRREAVSGVCLFVLRLITIRLAGVAVVWTVHNVTTHESRFPRLERLCKRWFVTRTCDELIVHCDAVAETLLDELGLPGSVRDEITVIPHGHFIDNYENDVTQETARRRLDIPASVTVFLFFGLIRRYKGVFRLIDAFEQRQDPDTHLLVAGNPTSAALDREITRRTQNTDGMTGVYEYIPDDEVQWYMNAADAVVLPYRAVTTSGVAVLGMSFGNAIVAPRLGCLPTLLDETGAVLYDSSAPDGLVGALERATDRTLDEMGAYNLDAVRDLDWETIADQTQAVYASARTDQSSPARPTASDSDETAETERTA